jgi:hypothetical protein
MKKVQKSKKKGLHLFICFTSIIPAINEKRQKDTKAGVATRRVLTFTRNEKKLTHKVS